MTKPEEKETALPPELLKNVEDLFAEGLTLQDVATLLDLPFPTLRGYAGTNPDFKTAMEAGKERAKLQNLDQKRRIRLAHQANFFIPNDDDLDRIEELARLSWAEVHIAESFEISISTWATAKKKFPKIKEFLDRGVAQSGGRLQNEKLTTWRPTPEQLVRITTLAAEGYTPDVISRQLGLGVDYLRTHIKNFPEVKSAYLDGFADWEKEMTDLLMQAIRNKNNYAQSNIMFMLKSRKKDDWHDAAPTAGQQAVVQPNRPGVNNTIAFSIPKQKSKEEFTSRSSSFREDRMRRLAGGK